MRLPFKTDPVFTLIIGGKPMPCPRPRKGKHGVYMPPKYMAHKEEMIKQIKRLMEDKGIVERISGPLAVSIVFVHKRTRDLKKKSAPDSRVFKVTRPDIDNLQKTIFDALQGAELFCAEPIGRATGCRVAATTLARCRGALLRSKRMRILP